jgi:hypothetical protein
MKSEQHSLEILQWWHYLKNFSASMNMFSFVCFMATKSMSTVESGTNTVVKNAVYTNGTKMVQSCRGLGQQLNPVKA